MSNKLKPCPFCGSEAELSKSESGLPFYRIWCKNPDCIAGATQVKHFDKEKLANAWNTRWNPTCQWVDHGCTECDYEDYSRFDVPERCPGCGREVVE